MDPHDDLASKSAGTRDTDKQPSHLTPQPKRYGMSKQPSPWMRRVGSAALFATLGATIIGFGVAGAVDGGSTSTSTPSAPSSESRPDKAGHHHGGRLNLTDEQKTCLTEAGITKPEGRPTQAERDAFKAAAETCGITLPARPTAEPGLGAPDEAPGMGGRFGDGHGPGGRFGRGPGDGDHFDGPGPSGPSGSTGSTGTDGAPVEPTSGS